MAEPYSTIEELHEYLKDDEVSFEGTGITQNEFEQDFNFLTEKLTRLREIFDNIDSIPADKASAEITRLYLEMTPTVQKYASDERADLGEALYMNLDTEALDEADEFFQSLGDVDFSEYDADMDELKTLYDAMLADIKNGASDDQIIASHDAFYEKLFGIATVMGDRDDTQRDLLIDRIMIDIGMPDHITPEHMMEYTSIIASRIKELMEKGDLYTRQEARDTLIAEGIENPTDDQISFRFLKEKQGMFDAAERLSKDFVDKWWLAGDDDLIERLELLSGYTPKYIAQQLELIELEMDQLPDNLFPTTETPDKAVTQQPPASDPEAQSSPTNPSNP